MSDTVTAPSTTIEVRRAIRASRQRVFDAWTKAQELKRWHTPGPMTVARRALRLMTAAVRSM